MKVIKATKLGFCGGVRRSLEKAVSLLRENKHVYLSAPLIHNDAVLASLCNKNNFGGHTLHKCYDCYPPEGAVVLTPAHGTKRQKLAALHCAHCRVTDTTCPKVQENFRLIEEYTKAGYAILFAGFPRHAETLAARTYSSTAFFTIDKNFLRNSNNSKSFLYSSDNELNNDNCDTSDTSDNGTSSPNYNKGNNSKSFLYNSDNGLNNNNGDNSDNCDNIDKTLDGEPKGASGIFLPTLPNTLENATGRAVLMSQTTFDEADFFAIASALRKKFPSIKLRVHNTICPATRLRQDALKALCKNSQVEALIIAGSKTSSNTMRLFDIAKSSPKAAYLVSTAKDLSALGEELKKYKCLGLSGGSSTSPQVLEEVEKALEKL